MNFPENAITICREVFSQLINMKYSGEISNNLVRITEVRRLRILNPQMNIEKSNLSIIKAF